MRVTGEFRDPWLRPDEQTMRIDWNSLVIIVGEAKWKCWSTA